MPERPTYLPNCVGWRHEPSSGLMPVTDAASVRIVPPLLHWHACASCYVYSLPASAKELAIQLWVVPSCCAGCGSNANNNGGHYSLQGQAAAGSASAIATAAAAAPGILQQPSEAAPAAGALSSGSRQHHTAAAFHAAYAAGTVTPSQVAENVIAAVAASEAQVCVCGGGGELLPLPVVQA